MEERRCTLHSSKWYRLTFTRQKLYTLYQNLLDMGFNGYALRKGLSHSYFSLHFSFQTVIRYKLPWCYAANRATFWIKWKMPNFTWLKWPKRIFMVAHCSWFSCHPVFISSCGFISAVCQPFFLEKRKSSKESLIRCEFACLCLNEFAYEMAAKSQRNSDKSDECVYISVHAIVFYLRPFWANIIRLMRNLRDLSVEMYAWGF